MVRLIFPLLLLFHANKLMATEAVVTVLEAPLFSEKSVNSKIVDYYEKGKVFDIHSKNFSDTDMTLLKEDLAAEMHLISNKIIQSDFYQLFDRRGRAVYILRKHVKVYTEDERELTARVQKIDKTDYRLTEPLPEDYPYFTPKDYRSFFTFGLGANNKTAYPYTAATIDQGFSPNYQLDFSFSKKVKSVGENRLYFGILASLSQSSREVVQEYRFDILGEEKWLTFGIGPVINYDMWKGEKDYFSGYFSILFHPLFRNEIEQSYDTGAGFILRDKRIFNTMTLSPRLGGHFVWGDSFFAGSNIVFGTNAQIHFPAEMKSSSASNDPTLWYGDSYNLRPEVEFSFYLGIEKSI